MDDHAPKPPDTEPDAPLSDAAGASPSPFAATPVDAAAPSDTPEFQSVQSGGATIPLADALPGDAAPTPLMPLDDAPAAPRVTIIRPPASPVAAVGPRGGSFTLWALIWVAAWAGCMSLALNHRFDRKFDWNTSYFSIAARNLVHDGFVKLQGGVYLTAGGVRDNFYAGHPPLTAWLLAGWMKAFGTSDAMIRALPLTFTALNLLLLFALVKRTFGAPAALAATIICSLLPMTAVYAEYVNMEPFVLTFILGASLGYLGWARSGSTFGFLFMCLCVILGCWTDWPMYIFTGFLAIAHFFRRRDLLTPLPREAGSGEDEEARPGPPLLSSLFLIVLPMAVFATFLIYQKLNGSGFEELRARATERMNGGYRPLLDKIKHPRDFIGLYTPTALLLAALGAMFWAQWSRRLSLAGGEAGRRAAFRILLCLGLMQLTYTMAFPEGAGVHEFWQYYLIVPVAVLAAAFCTWLTVVGGAGRRFSFGLFDRAGWAVAASIPFLAIGPIVYRMQVSALGKEVPPGDLRLNGDYAGALATNTKIDDIILTDWMQGREELKGESKSSATSREGLGFALPWYTNRTMFTHEGTAKDDHDTRSIEGIKKICEKYKDHRILYLWSGDGPSALEEKLNIGYPRQFEFGRAVIYLIQGAPDPGWKKAGIDSGPTPVVPTPVVPSATKPATTQATTRRAAAPASTIPSTAPASGKPAA